jgi:hypothetical protein
MKRFTTTVVAALALAVLGGRADAQPLPIQPQLNPFNRPIVSPFLNLTRPGNAGVNYYALVRPLEQQNAAINQLQQVQAAGLAAPAYDLTQGAQVTGHGFGFQNHYGYFQNWRSGGAGGLGTSGVPGVGGGYGLPGGFGGVGGGFGGAGASAGASIAVQGLGTTGLTGGVVRPR